MNTKILLHIKVILFVVLQCVFTSAVKGQDVACKVGEGWLPNPNNIFTSGLASQCSGVSKITTEADCKLAAEYNSKNNIDKNEGDETVQLISRHWIINHNNGIRRKTHIS